jgi:hypothetical protein
MEKKHWKTVEAHMYTNEIEEGGTTDIYGTNSGGKKFRLLSQPVKKFYKLKEPTLRLLTH